ncbi:MAG: chemotaxis protein CheW [Chloroflexi bacterium]|nr:chemotaxis protein CheW [Chloroflexota bacterium]MBT5319460.1 chemotaxis protein CheW [Chloroflexota bacterium]
MGTGTNSHQGHLRPSHGGTNGPATPNTVHKPPRSGKLAEEITNNTQAEQQLVVFDLAQEAYGVDIGAVREIIRMQDVTSVPHRGDYVSGVINLRGRITPVMNLRKRFDLAEHEITRDSRIVVVDIDGDDIGMIVDAVTEVLRISTSQIEPPSTMIAAGGSDYTVGIAKLEERLVLLLDLERVLTTAISGEAVVELPAAA